MGENTVTVREARARLADHIDRAEEGVPTVITRNGAPVAAVVPIAGFEALEAAVDVMLAREAEAVLAEGGPTVTMAELLADLFAEQGQGDDAARSTRSASPPRHSGSSGPSAGPTPCASWPR
ncbi:type II toxin-antitoxin system Phd/YefM family antitoxin [Streptomyces mobaraensis NBRC 13819 = DSM 40847]|uniref:Antitoxin n=1 Tax=Streptomyces mobaraensis (strain ATCC 29032 / DSM 40847 / JCM 4168 / NBRC 13819 / NCIMB 11159 / IPCR 16-22) TaxID=1223523 RepID=M3C3P0_STRM1|nr:hypothetical protein H340_20789 [Streptomyces mobaraensis NBRC 13819 = DSM 40847]QTT74147.1 type II toxin-antitoxin system Phd/YefM family antitoxin [Streptomyces mobaraensis NBRC 13819 = DSM 40847]